MVQMQELVDDVLFSSVVRALCSRSSRIVSSPCRHDGDEGSQCYIITHHAMIAVCAK